MPNRKDLQGWLDHLEQLQPDRIELGLARITRVAESCGLSSPAFKILTVAGTNGKGSTVAYAANILAGCGLRVGVYTSPHFVHFNERIVIDNQTVSDSLLCEAFEYIESHRDNTDLTYFEFTTLAAMYAFERASLDVAVLEVGLGGRLDAVNAWHSDVACITSIGIDHIDWLGDDREAIGREKAGVARAGRPLISGDANPPASIALAAAETGAVLLQCGRDFSHTRETDTWEYQRRGAGLKLPIPAIDGQWAIGNASVAITACAELLGQTPELAVLENAMCEVSVPGRMQKTDYRGVPLLLDVAHNPQAAAALAAHLNARPGHTIAVFSCLQDKDAVGVIAELAGVIDHWLIVQLESDRAIDASVLQQTIAQYSPAGAEVFTSVIQAVDAGVAQSTDESRIVVFGSFHVVGPILQKLNP